MEQTLQEFGDSLERWARQLSGDRPELFREFNEFVTPAIEKKLDLITGLPYAPSSIQRGLVPPFGIDTGALFQAALNGIELNSDELVRGLVTGEPDYGVYFDQLLRDRDAGRRPEPGPGDNAGMLPAVAPLADRARDVAADWVIEVFKRS